jgi:hypothetical protein
MDFNADAGTTYSGNDVGSWTWTMRGQTVLVGDRAGNDLNANFGVGFGGLTYNLGFVDRSSGPTGFALAGGISYDARISPLVLFSPEFFVTWHQVPNAPGYADDVSSIYGVRLNLLWYCINPAPRRGNEPPLLLTRSYFGGCASRWEQGCTLSRE